ncbi:hypothetical protein LCGC14_0579470 [marine sediment metagenome]|uniref:ATP-dependent Clp protease proteolytic subunit n=1 Tax=marine sediment metagenome TaxID=412755 RepID=A0A0F9S0H1_9ZZZZ
MAKELLLYSPIFDLTAETLINGIDENMGEPIIIRANTPGGDVMAGWGIIAKMQEHGDITMKIDGSVASMGTFIAIFANKVEALDVSKIHLHRASADVDNQEDQDFVDDVNADLKKKLKAKIDEAKFKEITGVSINQLFDADENITVTLSAKQAKEVGLVDKVITLKPSEVKAFQDKYFKIAALKNDVDEPVTQPIKNKPKSKTMSIETLKIEALKAEHPDIFKEIYDQGVNAERDRVGAWATFLDVDSKKVIKAIKEGDDLTATATAELTRKSVTAKALKNIEGDGAEETETEETEGVKTAKEKKIEAFQKEVDINLGLNKKLT